MRLWVMIGRQVEFYSHPVDYAALEEYIRNGIDSVILADRSSSPVPERLASVRGEIKTFICPSKMISCIQAHLIANRGYWLVDVNENPVVEWWHSKVISQDIYSGRFYYVPWKFSDGVREDKDELFLETARKLFAWVRKNTVFVDVPWGRVRVGLKTKELIDEGVLILKMNSPTTRSGK
jgi:hypothetical protein